MKKKPQIDPTQQKLHRLSGRLALYYLLIGIIFGIISFVILYVTSYFGLSVEYMRTPRNGVFIITVLVLCLSFAAAYLIVSMILRPLIQIEEAAQQVAKGDFSVQIPYKGNLKEFGNTIESFNQMVRELNSVEIMRNDFVTNVSHEFKTPLSSIMGYATLLQDPELTQEERQEYIQKVFFSVEKLNDLTDNILRLSKLEHQEYLQSPITYRLDEQLREAMVLLEPKWTAKNIELDLQLPDITYTGQQALLFQVWTNLIGNAIKFTPPGGTIAVSAEAEPEQIRVVIRDTGVGMDRETQAHIFEKFYQADAAHRATGNGLGLPLCRAILELCGGEISVASEVGKGSEFTVRLKIS